MSNLRIKDTRVPLRRWIEEEKKHRDLEQAMMKGPDQILRLKKQYFFRKTTVAYAIAELLQYHCSRMAVGKPTDFFSLDNFTVHVASNVQAMDYPGQTLDIAAVSSLMPEISAQLTEPSFIKIEDENIQERMGRCFEVEISDSNKSLPSTAASANGADPGNVCRSFGILLYELYSGASPFPAGHVDDTRGESLARVLGADCHEESTKKVRYDNKKSKSYSTRQTNAFTALQELGNPSSICMMVQKLIECRGVYSSLGAARTDIHLLLRDPDCFLFDPEDSITRGQANKGMQLNFKKDKLYGREEEVTLITDSFCQVSSGENVAFFIGGYSGSGKTMLVHSLTTRIDVAGGFVLAQKVDQMTKERPLLGILSIFDRLCLLIKEKCSARELLGISGKLKSEFESDYPFLTRLLPNVKCLCPQLGKKTTANSVEPSANPNPNFTLKRFVRIVSSRLRPVMLFLDDLQWATCPTLELIESLLMGSSCFLFVGCYRDNEVNQTHPVSDLISRLKSSPIHTTSIILGGLKKEDLGWMIAETLGIVPRLCKCLSDIIFQKTQGGPLFAKEFLRSLVDNRLLKYSLRERRWIWDVGEISDENLTANVLHLLTARITSLPENAQIALKLLAAFGNKTEQSFVTCLGTTSQYSNFRHWLDQVVEEGFIYQRDSQFKFVHDKVQEAAYDLIPKRDKEEFHYNLGTLLLSTHEGQDLGGMIFQIVDQINLGKSLIVPAKQVSIAKLNLRAGSRAMGFSDFQLAHSYLNTASTMLEQQQNLWTSNYELSLQVYFLKAKSSHLCGKRNEAYKSLKTLLENGRVIEDKLDAYYLYAHILHACEESGEAYSTCCEVLSELNESIPNTLDPRQLMAMMKETAMSLSSISGDTLLEMEQIDGTLSFILKFLTLLLIVSYWKRPEMMAYIGCRIIRLTLEHGVCEESVFGLVEYAAVMCERCEEVAEIQEACRVAKAAMCLFKRKYDSSDIITKIYFCYSGLVEYYIEPMQICAAKLRKGYEVGMTAGESAVALYSAMRVTAMGLAGGDNLHALQKENDAYMATCTRLHQKLSMPSFLAHRETLSMLIDKGQPTNPQNGSVSTPEEELSTDAYCHNRAIYLNKAIQSFWLGYSQRCHHYAMRVLNISSFGGLIKLLILFYAALNAFRGIKNNNGNGSQFIKVKTIYKKAILQLRNAAEICPWNFKNKVFLLEAELYSFEKKLELARASYAAAITSANSSRFIHETGLACELAAIHYTKNDQTSTAVDFFRQAKECYAQWGSKMKVESVALQMEKLLSNSLAKEKY